MKIIFDDEQERRDVITRLGNSAICPDEMKLEHRKSCGLSYTIDFSKCRECWDNAICKASEIQTVKVENV